MLNKLKISTSKKYRNIFIVDSKSIWNKKFNSYSHINDVVLTYDLGLYKYISSLGGDVFFTDHLVDENIMQKNNFLAYKFFETWHFDRDNKDIFEYKGIPFGMSFRLDIWNDYIFYIRIYLCLSVLKTVSFDKIFVGSDTHIIESVLKSLNFNFERYPVSPLLSTQTNYYFPIATWLEEKINPKGVRAFLYKVRELISTVYGHGMSFLDKFLFRSTKTMIFIQEYHPTRDLLTHLRSDKSLQVLLVNFSRGTRLFDHFTERLLPIRARNKEYEEDANLLLKSFSSKKVARLVLSDGSNITNDVYNIIESRINESMIKTLRTLDSCISYLNKNTVTLEILIANIGHVATLFDCVCKVRGIPSYLIINGLLGPEYSDESKYATFINAYSESIKQYYFRGMDNIVILGDPRMDMYPSTLLRENINYKSPTITIGASGFNSVDLNSYVAVEFDFMHDVLSALTEIKSVGNDIRVIIKVRGNGYRKQYENFVEEFFPNLVDEIIDVLPIKEVLLRTDFYISIYSQTLFEASCLGIPVVYYKKDNEIMDPPFDGCSELVTVDNIDDLIQAFNDFQSNSDRYKPFLDRNIMEKYIGSLDGRNLERNKAFVYSLLEKYKNGNKNDKLVEGNT